MFKEMIDTGSALREQGQTSNINERAKYTANTKSVLINTANSNIDGTGTITAVMLGAANGTLIKQITIQAISNTARGEIRLFIYNPYSLLYYFLDEIKVEPVSKSGTTPAFSKTYELDYDLQSALSLAVSTQNADSFIITAQGLDYTY